ncbi:MAG: sulfite exporter TauE/SafE family protein, partial [Planctomycetota bacterium]
LLAYFVVAAGASYRYLKLKFVMMDAVKVLIPSSILGIILGAIVGHHLPRDVMMIVLGTFLLFIAVAMAKRIVSRYRNVWSPSGAELRGGTPLVAQPGCQDHDVDRPPRAQDDAVTSSQGPPALAAARWKVALCGFPGGFVSAMLGISGGVVTTPIQQVLARIPVKNAVANTLAKASVTVPIACLIIMVLGLRAGHFDFWTPVLVALCLVPGSIVGSQLGPSLTRRMSPVTMHTLFCAVALLMGIHMLFFSN